MLLDNLFVIVGTPGTAAILLGIVAFAVYPAASIVMCPSSVLSRRIPRGR